MHTMFFDDLEVCSYDFLILHGYAIIRYNPIAERKGGMMGGKSFLHVKNLSIFQKMILSFIIIIVFPVLFSFVVSNQTIEDLVITQNYRDTLSSIEIAMESVSSVINELLHASVYVCNDEMVQDCLLELNNNGTELSGKDLANRLSLLRKAENVITNVFFVNRINAYITMISNNGSIIYTNYSTNNDKLKEYLQEFSPEFLKKIGFSVYYRGIEESYVMNPTKNSSHVITWIKTVESKKDGSMIGALIVSLPEDEITNLMIPESIPVKRILLDSGMNVIASTYKPWLSKKFDSISSGGIPGNEKGYVNIPILNEGQSTFTYKKLKLYGWTLADIKPVSELSGKLHETSDKYLMLSLFSILVFLFMATAIARSISVPLHRLSKTMLETDLKVFSPPDSSPGKDEVRILENSFDTMRRNINNLIRENIDTEKKKREAELQALQSQINPHFLFNTLNAVRCAAETDKKEKVSEMIVALINLLSMSFTKGDEMITLEQELGILSNYVRIMQIRHGIRFELYTDIPEILKDYKLPKLLLQPLIENSIIHGFEGMDCDGKIEISAELQERRVIIRISDNGKGLDFNPLDNAKPRTDSRFSGIGTTNVNERIKMNFGSQYGIRFTGTPGEGTVVEVILPGLAEEHVNDD